MMATHADPTYQMHRHSPPHNGAATMRRDDRSGPRTPGHVTPASSARTYATTATASISTSIGSSGSPTKTVVRDGNFLDGTYFSTNSA